MYNAGKNCYNLPDTFTVTPGGGKNATTNRASYGNVYWVPLGGTEANPSGKPHVQRFKYLLDTSLCNYVVDTITTTNDSTYDSSYYAVASDWANTINLDPKGDAFQVRCPRCGRDMSQQPAFYHGIGYGTDSGANQFNTILPDSNSLGGAVLNDTGAGYKYCFMGSTVADLGNPLQWQQYTADLAGTPPPYLGTVNGAYGDAIKQNTLNLPCCANTGHHHSDSRSTNGGGGNNNGGSNSQANQMRQQAGLLSSSAGLQSLNVYPVPATMTLNFQYSLQNNIIIKISDVTGRLMDEQTLQNSTSTSFNVANYEPGIYLYQGDNE